MVDINFCKKKVIVGMSGGVDSSVAAFLLKKQGYEVEGLFMKNWEEDDDLNHCAAADDLNDAKLVCEKIGIKLHKINFAAEYWDKVFTGFLSAYQTGKYTPNPDIICNKEIKFKLFLEFAQNELNADFIATGHYVRTYQAINGMNFLLKGIDLKKDQSYFLYTLTNLELDKSLFPIGGFNKIDVRIIAKKLGLVNANKKDSTGICFIGKRNFNKFLSRYLPINRGEIVTVDGDIINEHNGLMYYTLGQRKGLGIGGLRKGNNAPWYVVEKDVVQNRLIVAQGADNKWLMSIGCIVSNLNWINNFNINKSLRCFVKVRHHKKDVPCRIRFLVTNNLQVIFDVPIKAVTPGQSAVFYYNDMCLGGGIIEQRLIN